MQGRKPLLQGALREYCIVRVRDDGQNIFFFLRSTILIPSLILKHKILTLNHKFYFSYFKNTGLTGLLVNAVASVPCSPGSNRIQRGQNFFSFLQHFTKTTEFLLI